MKKLVVTSLALFVATFAFGSESYTVNCCDDQEVAVNDDDSNVNWHGEGCNCGKGKKK